MTYARFMTKKSVTTPKLKTMKSFIIEITGRGVLVRTWTGAVNGLGKAF